MGIRFFCPNGHSLNVKSELAGKIGFCPKCNVRMLIPMESTRASGERINKDKRNLAKACPIEPSDDSNNQKNQGKSEFSVSPVEDIIRQVTDSGAEYEDFDSNNSSSDMLFDNPKLLWYARTQDGQEYGPATGDVFKEWIKQRRIGPLMPVWRQDWENWQEAGKVFPEIKELFERSEPYVPVKNEALAGKNNKENEQMFSNERTKGAIERLKLRQKKAVSYFWIICGLIAFSLTLLIVLIIVLLR